MSNKQRYCDELQRYVRIQDFCWGQRKTTDQSFRETWCRNNIFLVLWHGRSRKEMCGKILRTCNKTTQQFFKVATPCMDDHPFKKKKKMSQLENCLQFAHKLFWFFLIWLVFGDLIFCGLWTNLLVRSHNGQNLVTNAWRVWSRTFIIQENTGNIAVWETQHNNADKDCFKTLILREALKTRNQHQEDSSAFSEVKHLCQYVGCARNREAGIISLDAGLRMDGISALTLWDMVIEAFHSVPNKADGPKRELRRNPSAIAKSNMQKPTPIKHTNVIPTNIDHIPTNTKNSDSSAMLCVFEDNEAVIKMIVKGRSPTMRHVSRTTVLLWIGCLTGLIWTQKFKSVTLTPNSNSQTCWLKGLSHVMSGTIFFTCSISAISAPLGVPRISVW